MKNVATFHTYVATYFEKSLWKRTVECRDIFELYRDIVTTKELKVCRDTEIYAMT